MNKEKLIENMVSEVMEHFDFDKVRNVMLYLDWKWAIENGERTVPSSYRLMKQAESLLREVMQYYPDTEFHSLGTGGFMASLDDGNLSLQFILEEMTVDSEDFDISPVCA